MTSIDQQIEQKTREHAELRKTYRSAMTAVLRTHREINPNGQIGKMRRQLDTLSDEIARLKKTKQDDNDAQALADLQCCERECSV